MKKSEFLTELQDLLQTDETLRDSTQLSALEEWDSIAFMVLIAFFDKNFDKKLVFDDLAACKTPADLAALARGAIE